MKLDDEDAPEWLPRFQFWLNVYWLRLTTGIYGPDGITFMGDADWIRQKAVESALASFQKGLLAPHPFCVPETMEYQIDEEAMDAYLNSDDEFLE